MLIISRVFSMSIFVKIAGTHLDDGGAFVGGVAHAFGGGVHGILAGRGVHGVVGGAFTIGGGGRRGLTVTELAADGGGLHGIRTGGADLDSEGSGGGVHGARLAHGFVSLSLSSSGGSCSPRIRNRIIFAFGFTGDWSCLLVTTGMGGGAGLVRRVWFLTLSTAILSSVCWMFQSLALSLDRSRLA